MDNERHALEQEEIRQRGRQSECSDLLACPFCGCKKVEYHNGWIFGDRDKHIKKTKDNKPFREPSITCDGCGMGMSVGSFGWGVSDEIAEHDTKEIWNMRSC